MNRHSNKGKKYLTKRLKAESKILHQDKADKFKDWFEKNYTNIKANLYGENANDALHDTYIRVYEVILHTGLDPKNYNGYVIRSMFHHHLADQTTQSRFCELLPQHEKEDTNLDEIIEKEKGRDKLEADIMQYVYSNYKLREFELFKMYLHLMPAVNYEELSKITGIRSYLIQRHVCKIKKEIRKNDSFLKRRKALR